MIIRTFEMSGVTPQAKPAVARPLDGGVRPQSHRRTWPLYAMYSAPKRDDSTCYSAPKRDAAQGERDAEDDLGDVLQPALADVVAAAEVAQHGGQARAEGVGADLGRDGLAGDVSAAGAGAGVALELRDHGLDLGQLGELVPDRPGVAHGGLVGQWRLAVLAVGGDQGNDLLDVLAGQAQAAVALVAFLPAGVA